MNEIQTIMSERPRGGTYGIEVTEQQQTDFAMKTGAQFIDNFIPLPEKSNAEQVQTINNICTHDNDLIYWENELGAHGWCCEDCGKVLQWG